MSWSITPVVKNKGGRKRQMGEGKSHADGQGGRQDSDEAGDSVALQKCCLNMAPVDLLPGNWGCPPSFLYYYSLYLCALLPFPLLVCFLLFSPACRTLLSLFALILSQLSYSQRCFPFYSFLFLLSSSFLTNGQQLAIAAAEEVQPCVPDQSSTKKPRGSLLMQQNYAECCI